MRQLQELRQLEGPRICLECADTVVGRSDKKFCSDICRNAFNNRTSAFRNRIIRLVFRRLIKNRSILEKHLGTTVSKLEVEEEGFVVNYFTHQTTDDNDTWRWCFDIRYLIRDDNIFIK